MKAKFHIISPFYYPQMDLTLNVYISLIKKMENVSNENGNVFCFICVYYEKRVFFVLLPNCETVGGQHMQRYIKGTI